MIDLTPLEVRQKKGDFRRSFRGYDVELVNDFLELVADRMEELVRQNMDLNDRVAALKEELTDYREKDKALSDALMSAQKLREESKAQAEKESALMIREARAEAEEARQEAARSLAREEETLRQVRARRGQLVESFRRLLERELSELAVIEESLQLSAEAGRAEDRRVAGRSVEPEEPEAPSQPEEPEPEERPRAEGGAEAGGAEGPDAGEGTTDPAAAEAESSVAGRADGVEGPGTPGDAKDAGSPEAEPGEEEKSASDVQEDWLQSLVEE